ncbi:MAG: PHB depolymerase family esterase [Sandaracinaceae bacterium]
MNTRLPFRLLVAFVCLGWGCDTTSVPPDGSADASSRDAGLRDGGDARDAEQPDAGGLTDAGQTDAGVVDAGAPSDAGSVEGCGRTPSSSDFTINLTHGGIARRFAVHVPTGYAPTVRTPLVLNFHGRGSNASQQASLSGMNARANAAGFIAVHPEGVGNTWNGGVCCGDAMSRNIDDVGFTRAMLDRLDAELCVDPARVFAAGLSNGGFMAHRLGCMLSDRIAAVASVAAPNGTLPCSPGRGVPVIHFHGTADNIVRYEGFFGQLSVEDSTAQWVSRNGCGSSSEVFAMSDVRCEEWAGCDGGAHVQLCTIEGGGHQWPGGFTVPGLGSNTDAISATDAMWDFFVRHPRP